MIERGRVECLDGLRGLAALWVVIGHTLMLIGWPLPILSNPSLGVDLFIMLSGFLMVFQYRRREEREPWGAWRSWVAFWTRRYFRVAPLYYVTLALALTFGGALWDARAQIDAFLNVPPQDPMRYMDQGFLNVVAHVSFLFGFSPDYAFRTPLPDWSLGLEMQFYAAFPGLMLIIRRWGWIAGSLFIAAIMVACIVCLRLKGVEFPMPSFLPLKINVFLCGMLLAGAIGSSRRVTLLYLGLALMLAILPFNHVENPLRVSVLAGLVAIFFALVHPETLPRLPSRLAEKLAGVLGGRFFSWLGEISYGTYLLHLLILQPVIAMSFHILGYSAAKPLRFAVVLLIVLPTVYGLAWLTYRVVEIPGQALGRRLLRRFDSVPAPATVLGQG